MNLQVEKSAVLYCVCLHAQTFTCNEVLVIRMAEICVLL